MTVDITGVTARLAGVPTHAVTLSPVGYDWGSPATAGLWHVTANRPDGTGTTYFVKFSDTRAAGRASSTCPRVSTATSS